MTVLRTRDDVAPPLETAGTGPRSRRGAHRAAPPRVLGLLPVALVVLAVALLGGGVWALSTLGDRSVQSASAPSTEVLPVDDGAVDGSVGGEGSGAPTATPAPSSSAPAASSAAPSASAGAASAAPSSPPAAAADTDAPVVVLNATRTSGLARTTAATLEDEGWAISSTGNERGGVVQRTQVRYPDADLEASAAAVAEALGGSPEVVLDEDVADGAVTVVVGTDLAP